MIDTSLFFNELYELSSQSDQSLSTRIRELKRILQSIAVESTQGESMQFPDLFSRLDYIFKRYDCDRSLKKQINALRFNTKSPSSIDGIGEPTFYGYLYSTAQFLSQIGYCQMPDWLTEVKKKAVFQEFEKHNIEDYYARVVGVVDKISDAQLLVNLNEGSQIKVFINSQLSASYRDTLKIVKEGDKVALLNVQVDAEGNYHPLHVILHPDYLTDISAIAECFQNISGHRINAWQLFFIRRFFRKSISKPILKGNIANYFLDELIYAERDKKPIFANLLKATFVANPLKYTLLFNTDTELREFIEELNQIYNNLQRVVQIDLESEVVGISRSNSILEPAFIHSGLGLQGRLDLLDISNGKAKIVELKSGKIPWPYDDPTRINENHSAQARMYQLMVHHVFRYSKDNIEAAICYAAANDGSNIRHVADILTLDRNILNVRNIIVSKELEICNLENADSIVDFLRALNFDDLNLQLGPSLHWFRKDWDKIQETLSQLDDLERLYFTAYYRFITQELKLSKVGEGGSFKGHSALWNKIDVDENDESDAIEDLKIHSNLSHCPENPRVILRQASYESQKAYNFRIGDICVLYAKSNAESLPTEVQIFKCTISETLNSKGLMEVMFRDKQQEAAKDRIFNQNLTWCLERDCLDHSFNGMFKELFAFLETPKLKRDLILGVSRPENVTIEAKEYISYAENPNDESREEQNRILSEALGAKNYYLLIGPPGTGKTSIMLKHLIRELYSSSEGNVLLLAYTNKAVDEICDSVNNSVLNFEDSNSSVTPETQDRNFIRLGSKFGTSKKHHHNLLDVMATECDNRSELAALLARHRIFISTVTGILTKPELFDIKEFDTVIIDEASQILEPQLVGLLARFKKFILIGDQKQLPAISLQSDKQATRFEPPLQTLGFENLKESYFERLLRIAKNRNWDHLYGMLSYQGRMHPEVACFPNYCFYNNKLKSAGRPHQIEDFKFKKFESSLQKYLGNKRLLFIPSKETDEDNRKVNEFEAKSVALIVKQIISLHDNNGVRFSPEQSIGIITPYRNQIAKIRLELDNLGILDDITIDTVERYQGSQRDIIIMSLTVNYRSQLNFLTKDSTTDIDSGDLIDRKLNVAITRARKQFIVLGNPYLISQKPLYYKLMRFIKSRGGFIEGGVDAVLNERIDYEDELDVISEHVFEHVEIPDSKFKNTFNETILIPIKNRSSKYPQEILGFGNEYNRAVLIEYGRANFDENIVTYGSDDQLIQVPPKDRTLLYCYYNMRKHYFSQLVIFKACDQIFQNLLRNNNHKIACFDWGCGPATAALSLQTYLRDHTTRSLTNYFGFDTSSAMLERAEEFISSGMFEGSFSYKLASSISKLKEVIIQETLMNTTLCVFNFSYFFGNIDSKKSEEIAMRINELIIKYPLSRYFVLVQNSSLEKRNFAYNAFKRALIRYTVALSRREVIRYKNNEISGYESNEKVYFELLEL